MVSDYSIEEAHSFEQHLRRGYRQPSHRSNKVEPSAQGSRRRESGLPHAATQNVARARLPDLGNNSKCGNSLIGPDFYQNKQIGLLEDQERYRINAFDWNTEFPAVMKSGGFDAVIGNPPYVRIQALKEWAPIEVEHYRLAL